MLLPKLSRSDKRKLMWGVGGAALITLAVMELGKKPPKKKKVDYGIRVNALCSEFQVTDPTKLRAAQEETFNRFIEAAIIDPWTITSALIGKIAPHCRRPSPQKKAAEMRNPGEALFYYSAFIDTVCYLMARNLITSEQAIAESRVAQGWAIEQNVDPNEPALADPACATDDEPTPGGPPEWLTCTPPTVAMQVQGVWECRCPDGRAPEVGPGGFPVC